MNSFPKYLVPFYLIVFSFCQSKQNQTPDAFIQLADQPAVKVLAGSEGKAALEFSISDGYYILADYGSDHNLQFTKLNVTGNDQIRTGTPAFPEPADHELSGSDYKMKIFAGKLKIALPVQVAAGTASRNHVLDGKLSYQICNHQKCFFPRELDFKMNIQVP